MNSIVGELNKMTAKSHKNIIIKTVYIMFYIDLPDVVLSVSSDSFTTLLLKPLFHNNLKEMYSTKVMIAAFV